MNLRNNQDFAYILHSHYSILICRFTQYSLGKSGMRFISSILEKLQRHPKRIVFPAGTEPKIIQAARLFYSNRLGVPILLGDRTQIKKIAAELNVPLEGVRIINPIESEDLEIFARRYEFLMKNTGIKLPEARAAISKPLYFGAMMVALHQADAIIAGGVESTSTILRPLFQIIRTAPNVPTVSSCMILEFENPNIGEDGVLFLADCDVIPDPNTEQIADISVETAKLALHLLNKKPRVALLSFSTKGSASHPTAVKMQAAAALAQQKANAIGLDADFDGELQADAAIVPEIAAKKIPLTGKTHSVAGRANVLIFPDLNSGSISSRLLQHVTCAHAYGQILLGLDRPAVDISRGATAHDILGAAAIVGVQATAYNKLYPGAGQKFPGE